MPQKMVSIEFTDHDTTAALNYLMSLVKNGQVAGMVFAVRIKRGRCVFGSSGSVAAEPITAAGLASMLHHQMCRSGLSHHED